MAKGILAYRKLREEATTLQHHHPDWSFSKIGKKIGCSHTFVSRWVRRDLACETLDDQPRSGRPLKADAAAQQHIVMAAQLPECRTAGAIAAKVEQGHQLKLSVPTVKRHFRQNGLQHLSPVAKPMLTDRQKLARLRFSKAYLRRDKTSKRRWLNTDSKNFHVINMGTPLRRWCKPGARGFAAKPRSKCECNLGCSPAVGRLFAGARLSWWLGRDVVESQLLGRGVRRGNSTRNHALSGCARLIRLLSRCLLSATTRDDFAASQGPTWRCAAAKDGV